MAKLLPTIKELLHESLDYESYVQAFKNNRLGSVIAKHFNVSHELVMQLASDPDHGGKETVSSFIETIVALELERDGILGITVSRGEKKTDLIDGWGRMWDVKTPPTIKKVDFEIEKIATIKSIVKKLKEFPKGNLGILLCTSFLHQKDYIKLQETLKNALTDNQKFLVRLVHVEGIF